MRKLFFTIIFLTAISFTPGLYGADVQEITVRQEIDFHNIDPAGISNPAEYNIAANIYNRLLRFNLKTFEPEPDLAKSWEVSPDMLTYTFHLRDDVTWHKGYGKFTAKDVKYTFERIMKKKVRSRYRRDFKNVREVEMVDDYTVKLHMKKPDMSFVRKVLYYRPGYIVNQKAMETLGKQYNSGPIGTGPFIFQEWVPGSKAVLVANKDYFLGPPKLKKVTFLVVNEDAVAQMATEKGEIDMTHYAGLEQRDRIKKDPSLDVRVQVGLNLAYLIMNNCRKPFDDIRVRRAIHHAIDKKALVNALYAGMAPTAPTVLNLNFPAHNTDVKTYEHNPKKAKQLLAEAGFPQGFDTSFLYHPGLPWREYAPILQEQLRQVGIRVKLTMLDRSTVGKIRRKGKYDMLYGSTSRPPDPDIIFSTYFHSKQSPYPNMSCYKNKEVDRLIDLGNSERDQEKRWKIYRKIQEIMAEDTPVVPVNYRVEMHARKHYVKGYVYNPLIYYDLYQVYIEGRKK